MSLIVTGGKVLSVGGSILVSASGGAAFDFYVSPTGSGSAGAGGTLVNPWPISMLSNATAQGRYAAKRVGLLPGTYDVSGLMGTNENVAALTLAGGTGSGAQTYIGTSDSSGNFLRGTATLDAKGSSGFFGGSNNNQSPIMAARAGCNFWTVDGLVFTGFSLWAFHVGDSPSGGSAPTGWTIQNCEFTGGNAANIPDAHGNGTNLAPLIIYTSNNGLVTQNYFHDSSGYYVEDTQHFSCFYHWGQGSGATIGDVFTFNTVVNSGNFQGKEATQYNTEIGYNYIDMTLMPMTADTTGSPVFGFMSDNGLGTLTKIHHNVFLHRGSGISLNNTNNVSSYTRSPVQIYNNTLVAVDNHCAADLIGGFVNTTNGGIPNQLSLYNNLFYDNGAAVNAYGYVMTSIGMFALSDYNIFGSWNLWGSVPNSASGSSPLTAYHTLSAYQSAFGQDAHSSTNATNPFTNSGTFADQYQVLSGPAFGTGRVGGTSGGAACNVGAFDGTGRPGATWVH